jgi:hypothetical protein
MRDSRGTVTQGFQGAVDRARGGAVTDQVESDQVGTGQTGPEYTGGERLGTEQSGTEQSGTEQSGTERTGTDREPYTEAAGRVGSTTSDRGRDAVEPVGDAAQGTPSASGDAGRAAEESRAAEAVRGDEDRPGDPASSGAGEAYRPSSRDDGGSDDAKADDRRSDEERQRAAEDFAREHDPEQHDVAAGEEFRQPGDWTADDAGGPQVWDSEGNLVEGSAPGGAGTGSQGASGDQSAPNQKPTSTPTSQVSVNETSTGPTSAEQGSGDDQPTTGGRRTSELAEVRDGGYGVGSAAPLDDGALPLGHPVKAWEDTKTFVTPEHEKYHEAEPHVWFTDAEAAQRAGFRHID